MEYLASPFPEDEVTKVDPNGPRAARHRNLLRCVLLLHRHASWSEADLQLWRSAVGTQGVTTRALLDAIAASGIKLSG